MELSEKVAIVLQMSLAYANSQHYEYVTPEVLLFILCEDEEFSRAFEQCDGDVSVLSADLQAYMDKYLERTEEVPGFSSGMNRVLTYAGQSASNSGNSAIEIRHLIFGIWRQEDSYAVYYMRKQHITVTELLRTLTDVSMEEDEYAKDTCESDYASDRDYEGDEEYESGAEYESAARNDTGKGSASWKQYAPCLNETLTDANPLIGREDELERTIQILCRREKNNPLHLGEPGVGKTAITYGLVQRINAGTVPLPLVGSKIFALDLGGMLAGTQYRGDFEKRFKKVLSEIEKEENPIIYVDEIHNLSGSGAVGESSFDAANLLKPYLAGGHIRFIGATTFEEYKKYFERNKSLARRFQNVEIREPSEAETVEILKGLQDKYESFHGVVYEDGVLEYAVSMSAKHINERFLPDKAIDLMDEAGAYRKLHLLSGGRQSVDKDVINYVLTKICRVPIETVKTEEADGLATLKERMQAKVFGQDEAIRQVVNAIKFSKAGLSEDGKPLASLLFVGPTGVGKTEIARSLAEEMGVKLIRFDMSEYEEKHAVAKLIGAPAGYVGYEEGGLLTEEIRKAPFAVLLLDEIEKAHSDIYNILLQVMDYATLTDNQGRKADFRNVVLIMTSNAGANRIGKKGIGFERASLDNSVLSEEVKRTFQPEFRNRLNKIIMFRAMDEEMAKLIIGKKLHELEEMLGKRSIRMQTDNSAMELLLKKGVSEEFGAREIDRIIRNEIKPLFVDDILFGNLQKGGKVLLAAEKDSFLVNTTSS